MIANQESTWKCREPRGISMLIVAVAMIFVLGMAGLAIDLASLYVGRSQAQRAADAAALAGAISLVNGSCVTGGATIITAGCQADAIQQAEFIGNQNLIAGVNPSIKDSDISFDLSNPGDPRITVVAARDTAHGNPMPTFFIKIFGVNTANVSAQATAEAFNASDTGVPIGVQCVKPWFLPNCDKYHSTPAAATTDCASSAGYFVVPDGDTKKWKVANPGQFFVGGNYGGVYGEPITMKPGDPGEAAAPGQYYAAFIPNDTDSPPTLCPDCTKSSPTGGGTGSAAIYRENIECCNQNTVVCGRQDVTIASTAGNMVGPTTQGVYCLIHQDPGCGQDYLLGTPNPPCVPPNDPLTAGDKIPQSPFQVYGGPNNLNESFRGNPIEMSNSDSVVAVPIYQGILQSGQNQVNVIGFMKIFLKYADKSQQGTIYGYILDITACGGSGSDTGGNGSGVITTGGLTTPVRLIRTGS